MAAISANAPRDASDAARWLVNLNNIARKEAPKVVTLDYLREVMQAYGKVRQTGERGQFVAIGNIEKAAEEEGNRVFVRALRAARIAYRRAETPGLMR